jgi:hypothetical protein
LFLLSRQNMIAVNAVKVTEQSTRFGCCIWIDGIVPTTCADGASGTATAGSAGRRAA